MKGTSTAGRKLGIALAVLLIGALAVVGLYKFREASKARALGSQRISTPLAANTAPMRGRKAAAWAACTSNDSVALQGLYFWVLALSVTRSACSRSTSAST